MNATPTLARSNQVKNNFHFQEHATYNIRNREKLPENPVDSPE
jgi:hypothetical protein